MASSPLLQIKNLSVDFTTSAKTVHALENVSLEVERGEIVAIVGESGSGKSVTSLSILQLLAKPAANYVTGQILLNSTDLLQLPAEAMHAIRGNEIAMIFQEPMTSLNPVFSCGSQVMEVIQLHQKLSPIAARQKTIELFKKVKLPDPEVIVDRYPHQLSGGQRQRVMIAMAMSCNPSLLIADEPTTALDKETEKTIIELIKEIQQGTGMSVLFITHDLDLVNTIADRVIVMYKGTVVEQGTVEAVYHHPAHPYTKELLGYRNRLQNSKATSIVTERPLLSVRNLSISYPPQKQFWSKPQPPVTILDNISLEVKQGETLGLTGSSGSGKSTLGRAILRLIEPTEGQILFKGRDITSLSQKRLRSLRKDMQLVFQDPYSSLNPSMTIGRALMEPLQVHHMYNNEKQQRERVIQMLESVQLLPQHFNRYPHEFSGGQRQRIVIARALILSPAFIICDESVSALDASIQAQILELLDQLKKELGFTTIFISHDPTVVNYMCDRVIKLEKGKIL